MLNLDKRQSRITPYEADLINTYVQDFEECPPGTALEVAIEREHEAVDQFLLSVQEAEDAC